jgi:hypothetical protein
MKVFKSLAEGGSELPQSRYSAPLLPSVSSDSSKIPNFTLPPSKLGVDISNINLPGSRFEPQCVEESFPTDGSSNNEGGEESGEEDNEEKPTLDISDITDLLTPENFLPAPKQSDEGVFLNDTPSNKTEGLDPKFVIVII